MMVVEMGRGYRRLDDVDIAYDENTWTGHRLES